MTYSSETIELLIPFVERLDGVQQTAKYHPEGDVLTHTLQVVNRAFKESSDVDLIMAALLHDIGKVEISHGHEQVAVEWLQSLCSDKTLWLIDNHIKIRYYLTGEMRKQSTRNKLLDNIWFKELVILSRWDLMGRNPNVKVKYDRIKLIEKLEKLFL